MAKYRKIDVRIWNDAKFMTLSDDGKLVFLMLLTHPDMTNLGAMRASEATLSDFIDWSSERLSKALAEAFAKGMAKGDPKAKFLVLPNFLKYNRPESPNVVKSWETSLDLLPECSLKNQLIQDVKAFTEALPEAFSKALPEAFRKTYPNQEQEQEQEQEQNNNTTSDSKSDPPKDPQSTPSKPRKPPAEEPEHYQRFAREMWAKIQPITGSAKEPNFNAWARQIRLLVETDGRSPYDVQRVFEWANADVRFWQRNILSADALRRNFDKLWAQYTSSGPPDGPTNGGGNGSGVRKTRDISLADDLSDKSWAET